MPKYGPFGSIRDIVAFTIPAAQLAGTSATVVALSVALGFRYSVESATLVATTALGGAGGTRTISIRKGNATGTVVGTLAATVTALGTSGNSAAMTITANTFTDTDTLSITVDSGGTTITSGQLDLLVVLKEKPQG